MTIILNDRQILNKDPIELKIGEKTFQLQLLSAYYYDIFYTYFLAYLFELRKIFGKNEIVIGDGKFEIKEEFANIIMHNMKFKYIVYELFKISCYTELLKIEKKLSSMTELERQVYKKEFKIKTKIVKWYKRKSILDFTYFLKSLDPADILNIFGYIMLVNIHGFKKKVKVHLKNLENMTGETITAMSIMDTYTDYKPEGNLNWKGKMKIINGRAVPISQSTAS